MHFVYVAKSNRMKKSIPSALRHRLSALIILFSLGICASFWTEAVNQRTLTQKWEKTKAISPLVNGAQDLNISFAHEKQQYGIATPIFAQLYQTFEESAIVLAGE